MTRRRVLGGAAGLAVIVSGTVVLTDVERRHSDPAPTTTAAEWEVVLTRVANGLPTTAGAVHAAAAHPVPQLLVGIPLTAAEATLVRTRGGAPPVGALSHLLDRNPTLTRLAPRAEPPSARTVRAWLTHPDRQLAGQLYDTVGGQVPVEVHLTRWSRADLDHQYKASDTVYRLRSTAGIRISSIFEPNNAADIEVMTTRALTPDQQRTIRQLIPAAVFTIGTVSAAAA